MKDAHYVPVAAGTFLGLTDLVSRDRNRRPVYGGRLQHPTMPGYHMLMHAGAYADVPVAVYEPQRQVTTQPGGSARMTQIYTVDYQSFQG